MQSQNTAGTLLPQNCPELAQFITAQGHIRAASHIIDALSVVKPPQLSRQHRESFRNLATEIHDELWQVYGEVQDLMSAFYLPLYPVSNPLNPSDHA